MYASSKSVPVVRVSTTTSGNMDLDNAPEKRGGRYYKPRVADATRAVEHALSPRPADGTRRKRIRPKLVRM